MSTGRTLLHFAAIGLLSFVARRGLSEPRPAATPLAVTVAADATEAEVGRAIDEAAMIELALAAGWSRTDPVIVDRLLRNMRFAQMEGDATTLLARAHRLDMPRRDPVVRRRLLERAEKLLIAQSTPRPTADDLRAHRDSHPERFERPGALRLAQLHLSRDRHGEALEEESARLAAQLEHEPTPADVADLGDPFLLGRDLGWMLPRQIDGQLGPRLSERLASAPAERWIGPLTSAYGVHFVWIAERRPPRLPPMSAIAAEVEASWRRDAERQHLRRALDRLRDTHVVEVKR